MSSSRTYAAIGFFTLGGIVIFVTAALVLSNGHLFEKRDEWVMYFGRSVQGLQIGAPVKLQGVTIGEVTGIESILRG